MQSNRLLRCKVVNLVYGDVSAGQALSGGVVCRHSRAVVKSCSTQAKQFGTVGGSLAAGRKSIVCQVEGVSAPPKTTDEGIIRATVPSREVPGTLGIQVVDCQDGCRLVKVSNVSEGSALAEAGVKEGMVIVGVSDQMDETLIWPVAVTPRLINMQRLINNRQATNLTIELEPVEWTQKVETVATPSSMAQAAAKTASLQQAKKNLDDAEDGAESSLDALEVLLSDTESDDDEVQPPQNSAAVAAATAAAAPPPGPSAAETAAAIVGGEAIGQNGDGTANGATLQEPQVPIEYAIPVPNGRVAALLTKAKSYTKTREKRLQTLNEAGDRNNVGLLLGAVAVILLPSILILGYAAASGFLDQLYTGYRY